MESAGGNKQNMVGADHAVTSVDGGTLDNRQNVALHSFAGNVWPVAALSACNLVDLVQKDDSRVFHTVDRSTGHLIHVNQPLLLFLDQVFEGFVDFQLTLFGALPENVGQHVLNVDIHLLHTLVGDDFKRRKAALTDVDFYHAFVQFAFAQLLT